MPGAANKTLTPHSHSPPEAAVVSLPDAGPDHLAVVVERRHAPPALSAVVRSQWDLRGRPATGRVRFFKGRVCLEAS